MSESYKKISEPGIAAPKYDPRTIKGTKLHKEMLEITSGNYNRAFKPYIHYFAKSISKLFNKYHLLSYKYFIFQRYFPLRLLNLIIFLIERKRISKIHYSPPFVTIDVCNICNLCCPGCVTGLRDPSAKKENKASLERMKRIIDQTAKRSIHIDFFHWGEPLLNEDFYAACAYAAEKGLWTTIHTNMNIKDKGLAQKIIDSKLCKLVFSCDGATQQVYKKYRKGGNIDLVFANVRKISYEKRKRNLKFPWITAKYVVFDHNWHEIKLFKEKAFAAGANEVLFAQAVMGGFYETRSIATAKTFNLKELKWEKREDKTCTEIWDKLLVANDGSIYPCCACFRNDDVFVGPEYETTMKVAEKWNADKFRHIRRFFIDSSNISLDQLPQPCNTCRICSDIKKTSRKDDFLSKQIRKKRDKSF